MLKRSVTVFDELKQSVRDIETLSDPTTGEITIECPETIAGTFLPPLLRRFAERHPSHTNNRGLRPLRRRPR